MSNERNALVDALYATYGHIESLERISAENSACCVLSSDAKEQAQRIITAILAMDEPTLADCTPKQAPPVKTVSAETLRRLRAVMEKNASIIDRKKFAMFFASMPKDNITLSDLDEILAALEQRQ